MQLYGKLVRDRIPDVIRREGRTCVVEELDDDAYLEALKAKLVEEATEAAEAADSAVLTELADVIEVVEHLLRATGFSEEALRAEQLRRREERGGFTRLYWLVRTE